jgi:cytochrome c551/c552
MKLTLALIATAATLSFAGHAVAGAAEDIIAKEKCSKCHTATTTKKGPSWASVAEKYKDKPEMPAKLVNMLKTGVPLSGKTGEDDQHKKLDGVSDADLKAIVGIVLSTK